MHSNEVRTSKEPRSGLRLTVLVSALTLASLLAGNQAFAASEKVLWSFGVVPGDGMIPTGGVVMDAGGNLYGTTVDGGTNNLGTAFKLTSAGEESPLWNFGIGFDGSTPLAGVIMDKSGNLYGTTNNGGLYDNMSNDFGGTVFKLTSAGQESVLWNFGNGTDGRAPDTGLLMDANGDFFGTTAAGGTYSGGITFELTSSGQESVLWNFGNGTDGSSPSSNLLMDASGNLYGTTLSGGADNLGTVFKLTPPAAPSSQGNWTESVLWSFGNGSDGQNPGGLIMDANGNFFGTTSAGGTNGVGIVFELTSAGQESVLWNFGTGTDGQFPSGIIMDASGNLYGTTGSGGTITNCSGIVPGCGTAFELSPPVVPGGAWTEAILWNFGNGTDGSEPSSGLIMDASGNLYGETFAGGPGGFSAGTVFEISNLSASNGQILLKTPRIAFPNTAVGQTSSYKLAIRNTGTGQLTGTVAPPPAPFGL